MRTILYAFGSIYLGLGVWHLVAPDSLQDTISTFVRVEGEAAGDALGATSIGSQAGRAGTSSDGSERVLPLPPAPDSPFTPEAPAAGQPRSEQPQPLPAPPTPQSPPLRSAEPTVDGALVVRVIDTYFMMRRGIAEITLAHADGLVDICDSWDVVGSWDPPNSGHLGIPDVTRSLTVAADALAAVYQADLDLRSDCVAGRISPGEFLDRLGSRSVRDRVATALGQIYPASVDTAPIAADMLPGYSPPAAFYLAAGGRSVPPSVSKLRVTSRQCSKITSPGRNGWVGGVGSWRTEFEYEFTLSGGFAYYLDGELNYLGRDVTLTGSGVASGHDLVPTTVQAPGEVHIGLPDDRDGSFVLYARNLVTAEVLNSLKC
jgi:hypothetical protein